MIILNILKEWGINVPKETNLKEWGIDIWQETNIAEYLLKNKPKQCFYMDVLPMSVGSEYAEKFNQFEIIFAEVLSGEVSKENFFELEMKYRKTMTKLWLYNELVVEYALIDNGPGKIIKLKHDKISQILDEPYIERFKELQEQYVDETSVTVTEKIDLELFIQASMRDILCTTYYFKEYELIIIPSWTCFVVYFNDLSKYQIVKDIAFSEGLFLRPNTMLNWM